ncbi:hypothetical protein BYI23_B010880 [Burkholderia sp. YI23]|nr:hypothetical protein BYI23_B010880 [Burkholderia sp. YI23]
MNTQASHPIPEPLNRETGFYGFMDQEAPQMWPLAIRAVANATDGSFDNARHFLDSELGRRFAEAIYVAMSDEIDAHEAIRRVMRRWFKHPRG